MTLYIGASMNKIIKAKIFVASTITPVTHCTCMHAQYCHIIISYNFIMLYIGPTLKLKRHFIAEKYSELIAALYDVQDGDVLNEAHI